MSNKKPDKFVVKELTKINEKPEQVKPIKVSVPEPLVTIELLRHNRYIYTSPHTGKEYTWNGAGSQVDVPEKDATILLAKTRKVGGCCGSRPHVVSFFIRR